MQEVAAIRLLPEEEREKHRRFRAAMVTVDYKTPEGEVRRETLADTGAFGGFAPAEAATTRGPPAHSRPTGGDVDT